MPRIPDDEIDRIKQQTDLAALVRSRGVKLTPHGNGHLVGRCPFHDDQTPSMVVTPGKGLFHCLGCGAAGNAIQFVQRFDGVSFRHAFELLAEGGAAAFSTSSPRPTKHQTACRLDNPLDPEASDAELLAQVVDYYHQRLLDPVHGQLARAYLVGRGIDPSPPEASAGRAGPSLLTRFKLGVADRSLGLRLPKANRKEGRAIRERLQALGILRESGHEHFNGSLMVPIFDEAGQVVEVYGRKLRDDLRKGTPRHLYLSGPHAGIWNHEALRAPASPSPEGLRRSAPRTSEIVLCEAALDALTLVRYGIEHTTFVYGTQGFADWFLDELVKHQVRTVRLAYDNDEAGNQAAERDAARLMSKGLEVYRVKLPHGMDVNEYARKVQPADQALRHAIASAEWLGLRSSSSEEGLGGQPSKASPSSEASAKEEAAGGRGASASPRCAPARSSLVAIAAKEEAASSAPTPELRTFGEYHVLNLGPRSYRVGGLLKNNSLDVLKISLRLRVGEWFHLDGLDLLRDGDRRRFIERAAEETRLDRELIKRDLGKLLLALEQAQEDRLSAPGETVDDAPEMTGDERAAALGFLREPGLVDRIREAFDACGLVGEESNRLAAYLACTSRKLARPLAVIIQSTSAAGKSTLMDAVLAMFPEEERVQYSAMTGQSLYYLGETNLQHRILAISEEEGAEKASYALKLLQSEGALTIASTGKDPQTGRMETQEYHVEGPVMIFLTTTAIDIDEELMNRCLVLTVDESREQTERIHQLQREARTLEGLRRKKRRDAALVLLQNVQRLLDPVAVVNPWADRLTFTAARTRTRRDHEKYLALIEAITLLHQHQRPQEEDAEAGRYLPSTVDDIRLANELAPELLARSLDELPPQTRRLLDAARELVRAYMEVAACDQACALFTRRELREAIGWSEYQVRAHLRKLEELDYVGRRAGDRGLTFRYVLLVDADEESGGWNIGLIDPDTL